MDFVIMTYRYSLDKSSNKFICPKCNKKTFVRYKDNETNHYLENNIGRCDRESKCQFHNKPNSNVCLTIQQEITKIEPNCHTDNVISHFGRNYDSNNFIVFLKQYFSIKEIQQVVRKYFIGTSSHWSGATIFWQIDKNFNVCAGKVMLYDKYTGKRVKNPYPHISWMHKVLHVNPFVLQQCLFGIHELPFFKGNTIAVVESEKTAIIMSMIFTEYLWLATGSKTNFKESLLKPLHEHNVIVFPDKTEFVDWNKKVDYLKEKGFNISCSDLLESKNLEEGGDLIDLILYN